MGRSSSARASVDAAQPDSLRFLGSERVLGALRDQPALLFGESRIRCSMKGSASAPSSATINGVLCVRDSRSSLATIIGALLLRHLLRSRQLRAAVERVRALASFDLDELSHDFEPPAQANPAMAARCASRPRPDLACFPVADIRR